MTDSFSVVRRNYGHWDVTTREHGRVFRLRGGPGKWIVFDERLEHQRVPESIKFKDQSVAMAYICAELMHELLTVEGHEPYVMERWNV